MLANTMFRHEKALTLLEQAEELGRMVQETTSVKFLRQHLEPLPCSVEYVPRAHQMSSVLSSQRLLWWGEYVESE